MGGRSPIGNNGTCSALCRFSVTSPTAHNQSGSFWCWFLGGWDVYILGPCGSLQRPLLWGWEFLLLLPQPPQVFSVRGLRLYFPALEPWVVWSVSIPSWSSWFICVWMWDRQPHNMPPFWVHQLCPYWESSLSSCPSLPLLQVWMNVSSLTPWLLDFSIQFNFLSVLVVCLVCFCFCFRFSC